VILALLAPVSLALCIVLPGALLLRRIHPDVGPLEVLCVGGALGLFAVPYIAFVPAYALGLFLNAALVVSAAAVLVFALRKEARAAWLDRLGLDRLDRRGRRVVLLMLGVGALYYIKYDPSELLFGARNYLRGSGTSICLHELLFSTFEALNPGADSLALHAANQNLSPPTNGNVAVYGALMALQGWHGYRVLAALVPALIGGVGFLVGERYLGRFALPGAALLALNPQLFAQMGCDRSALALLLSLLVVYFCVNRPTSPVLLGGLIGLGASTGLRYLPATFLLGVAAWVMAGPRPLRNLLGMFAAFALVAVPWAHQLLVVGHAGPDPYVLHQLGPLQVMLPEFMNLPFLTGGLTRPPLAAMPAPLLYLFGGVRTWGLLLCTLMVLGVAHLARTDRRLLGLLLGMAVPSMGVVSLQGYHLSEDSLFIALTWTGVLFLLGAAGVQGLGAAIRRSPPRAVGLCGVVLATLSLGMSWLADVEYPVDPRRERVLYLDNVPSREVQDDAREFGLLPSLRSAEDGLVMVLFGLPFTDLAAGLIDADDLSRPARPEGPEPALGPAVAVRIHLSGPCQEPRCALLDPGATQLALTVPPRGHGLLVDLPGGPHQVAPIRVLVHQSAPGAVTVHKLSMLYDPQREANQAAGQIPSAGELFSLLEFDLFQHLFEHREMDPVLADFPAPNRLVDRTEEVWQSSPAAARSAELLLRLPVGTELAVWEHLFVGPSTQGWQPPGPRWMLVEPTGVAFQ